MHINKENNIIPKTVEKSVRDVIEATKADGEEGDMNKAASEMTKKELMKFGAEIGRASCRERV